ncbi:MAG: lytic transglycosylase domain-containing protein [Clostridiales bacterium]|nr:lytic transglycosylase domain-containing protein [Clostridiales bacterium]
MDGIKKSRKTGLWIAALAAFVAAAVTVAAFSVRFLYPQKYKTEITEVCQAYGVPESLVRAVIKTESSYRASAVSGAGAVGLMQLMPQTAKETAMRLGDATLCEKLTEPRANITLGTAHLAYLLRKYELSDALAAYNAGEGNLLKWKAEGKTEYPFKETRDYVQKVLRAERAYRRLSRRA